MLSQKHIYYIIITVVLMAGLLPVRAANRLYKVAVGGSGIYEITPEQLKEMGMGSAGDVTVYGCGAAALQSFDFKETPVEALMPEVPSMVMPDGRLIFYAEGPEMVKPMAVASYTYASLEFNSAERNSYYFIGPKADAARVVTADADATGPAISTHTSALVYHPMISNPARSGTNLLGDDLTKLPDGVLEIRWPTPDMSKSGRMNLRLRGVVKGRLPRLNYTLGSVSKTMSTMSGVANDGDYDIAYDASDFKMTSVDASTPSAESVTKVSYPADGHITYAAIEQATLTYLRDNRMPDDGSALTMLLKQLARGTTVTVSNVGPSTVVWDVTTPAEVVELPVAHREGNAMSVVSVGEGHIFSRLVAFDPEAHQAGVTLVGAVETGRLAELPTPELVILTAPAFRSQAERLAEVHTTLQGMSVAIVEPMEVFNEYSSGAVSPYAIRRFMKSLYDREPGKLKHLLIIGPSTYDPTGRLTGSYDPDTHVVTYQIENLIYQGNGAKNYCTDAFYGMLDDDDMPDNIISANMSINVGRISGINESLVKAYVDKVYKYLTEAQTVDARSHVLVIGDYGDKNGHLTQAAAIADSIQSVWAPHSTVNRLMLSLFGDKSIPLDKMVGLFNKGVGYVTYSGHGSPTSIGSNMFFKRSSASLLTNTTYPFMMLSTCHTMCYDRGENGVGETLLYRDNGGAIAAVGAGRSVQMNLNQYLNIAVGREYFSLTGPSYIGDVFRRARNSIMSRFSSNELAINTSCYNLLGDPALPVCPHSHNIAVDAANEVEIRPLSTNMLSGTVTDAEGNIDTGFNGRIIANLYAPAVTDFTTADPSQCEPVGVTRRETLIATSTGSVSNGVFNLQLHCPEVSTPGDGHVVTLHALSADGPECAVTSITDINIGDLDDNADLNGGDAPEIESLYINDQSFNDGDVVVPGSTLYAVIIPSLSGLTSVTTLGRPMYVDIDGRRYSDLTNHISYDANGKALLAYNMPELTDGLHEVTLVISDNAGHHVSQSCRFHVAKAVSPVTLVTDTDTATDIVDINLSHTFADEPTGRLIIEDAEGNTVLSRADTTFPYRWNLTDNDGETVPDGRYTLHARLRNGTVYTVTPVATIVVVKN